MAVAVDHNGQQLTYAELNRRANQLAHYLRNLGVGPEVLVGLCMERSIEMVCRVLLERYGVVFRELTLRETFPVKWRELLINFRRLEDRGDELGGVFGGTYYRRDRSERKNLDGDQLPGQARVLAEGPMSTRVLREN